MKTKRFLSAILSLVMILSALPLTAVSSSAYDVEATEISVGETLTATITKERDFCDYFEFTPDEDGIYILESFSDNDTCAFLADEYYNSLAFDDDSGYDNNFVLACRLKAGKTYIFVVTYYHQALGSFEVNLRKYIASNDDYSYELNDDETISITGYYGYEDELAIPSEIDGHTVTQIVYQAFDGCSTIKNVTIPNSVKSIEYKAFRFCDSLLSVSIPNSVEFLDSNAFWLCDQLHDIFYEGSEEDFTNLNSAYLHYQLPLIHFNTLENDYVEVSSVPATCDWGKITYQCPHGYETEMATSPIKAHITKEIYKEPTCTQRGQKQEICTVCEKIIREVNYGELGHNFVGDACTRCSLKLKLITIGTATTVNIDDGEDWVYCKITPDKTGKFTVWSESDDDTRATLMDSNMNQLRYDDDGGDGLNFKITYYFEKGETYYLLVRYFDSEITGSFTVKSSLEEFKGFPDVPSNAWFYEPIRFNVGMGYFKGYENGTFGPANNIQRQDFVVVLARIAGVDLSDYAGRNGGMSDVDTSQYYAAAVAWAVDYGIIKGYQNGKFGVGDPITREQACAIFGRYITGTDEPYVPDADGILAPFGDKNTVSPWAKSGVAWAINMGVISGTQSGNINPAGNANRAEISKILMNMSNNGLI